MSDTVYLPIRGAKFRPPANSILSVIPTGHPLELEREPTNQFDSNAVAVLLRSTSVGEDWLDELSAVLPQGGSSIEEFLAQETWHLGYVPAPKAPTVSALLRQGTALRATFTTLPDGWPGMAITEGVAGGDTDAPSA